VQHWPAPATRTHGDPHFWNILYPHDTSHHGCVFIDWEDWRIDMAAADLASMLALHWARERRLQHERRLLRHYLDTLRTETHTAYDWTALNDDYRLGHLQNIIVPIFQHHVATPNTIWGPLLQNWLLAFEDLDCAQLL
jgi:thiamine kinase-like enzyme